MTTYEVDLRSDTLTQPCVQMRRRMAEAEVGDSMFGEDPSVKALEEKVASHFGMASGLFVPSGTMSNQIAIALATKPGETILCEELSHFYLYESGATAALSGAQFEVVESFSVDQISSKLRPASDFHSKTTAAIFENTHNEKGGDARCDAQTKSTIDAIKQFDLFAHLDGARIWNAACAFGVHEKDLAKGFDTVSVCFSKGLSAPVGSMLLLGDNALLPRARHFRKRFGGAMRQAGILAAAAEVGFEVVRLMLNEDHRRCSEMRGFLQNEGFELKPIGRSTNMIYFRRPGVNGEMLSSILNAQSIGCFSMSDQYVRFVFHRDIDDLRLKLAKDKIKQSMPKILSAGGKS